VRHRSPAARKVGAVGCTVGLHRCRDLLAQCNALALRRSVREGLDRRCIRLIGHVLLVGVEADQDCTIANVRNSGALARRGGCGVATVRVTSRATVQPCVYWAGGAAPLDLLLDLGSDITDTEPFVDARGVPSAKPPGNV
jgi:hypothetical protein